MRILADENIPGETVEALRKLGHDVLWASVEIQGESDEELLSLASRDERLLLTLDKDFGELAFGRLQPASRGVILVRMHGGSTKALTATLRDLLPTRTDWESSFAVVEPGRVRVVPLPAPQSDG